MGFKCVQVDPCACFTNPVICPPCPPTPTPTGLSAFLSRTNTSEIGIILAVGDLITFNTPGVQFGTAITAFPDNGSFLISEPGFYEVTFVLNTALGSPLGTVTPTYSGIAIPDPSTNSFTLGTAGTTLVGNFMFQAITPGFLQLVITGLGINLAAGTNASITIKKLA